MIPHLKLERIQMRMLLRISIKLSLSLLAPFLYQYSFVFVPVFFLWHFLIIRPASTLFKFTPNFRKIGVRSCNPTISTPFG